MRMRTMAKVYRLLTQCHALCYVIHLSVSLIFARRL